VTKLRQRLPRGFRRGRDDSIACPHRDVTCCPECATNNPEIVEVYGRHYLGDRSRRTG
jgi:hypothetical protein